MWCGTQWSGEVENGAREQAFVSTTQSGPTGIHTVFTSAVDRDGVGIAIHSLRLRPDRALRSGDPAGVDFVFCRGAGYLGFLLPCLTSDGHDLQLPGPSDIRGCQAPAQPRSASLGMPLGRADEHPGRQPAAAGHAAGCVRGGRLSAGVTGHCHHHAFLCLILDVRRICSHAWQLEPSD